MCQVLFPPHTRMEIDEPLDWDALRREIDDRTRPYLGWQWFPDSKMKGEADRIIDMVKNSKSHRHLWRMSDYDEALDFAIKNVYEKYPKTDFEKAELKDGSPVEYQTTCDRIGNCLSGGPRRED